MQLQPLGIRVDEDCGLTGDVFMGKITKDPLMSPSKMLYLPSQGSSGVVITEEVLGVVSTYISIMYLHEKEQRGCKERKRGRELGMDELGNVCSGGDGTEM